MDNMDGFVKFALRFISLSLRRTLSTHPSGTALADDTKFARLEFGAFYFAIANLPFYEFVNLTNLIPRHPNESGPSGDRSFYTIRFSILVFDSY
jgi:hypothetical protein